MDFPAAVLLAVGYSEFKFRRLTIPVPQKGAQHIAASSSPSSKEAGVQCVRSVTTASPTHELDPSKAEQGRVKC